MYDFSTYFVFHPSLVDLKKHLKALPYKFNVLMIYILHLIKYSSFGMFYAV